MRRRPLSRSIIDHCRYTARRILKIVCPREEKREIVSRRSRFARSLARASKVTCRLRGCEHTPVFGRVCRGTHSTRLSAENLGTPGRVFSPTFPYSLPGKTFSCVPRNFCRSDGASCPLCSVSSKARGSVASNRTIQKCWLMDTQPRRKLEISYRETANSKSRVTRVRFGRDHENA